jgi:hypothetical protein
MNYEITASENKIALTGNKLELKDKPRTCG